MEILVTIQADKLANAMHELKSVQSSNLTRPPHFANLTANMMKIVYTRSSAASAGLRRRLNRDNP